MNYTDDYRRDVEMYWRQYYPNWTIPKGYHVHHIKPKSVFADKSDPRIHHPRNLVVLHPDDHITIHKMRGDKVVNGLIRISNMTHSEESKQQMSNSAKGRIVSKETGDKIRAKAIGRTHSEETKRKISEAHKGKESPLKGRTGRKLSDETKAKIAKSRAKTTSDPNWVSPRKGKTPWNKGIPMSEGQKRKISASKKRKGDDE